MSSEKFNLERFLRAQDEVFEAVVSELRNGRKQSHWIWFIFPQLQGLGRSWTAQQYGIASRAEAEAYLRHPILGPRLIECTRLVNAVEGRSIEAIFGSLDAMKFRSSMTLFANVAPDESIFADALNRYFEGKEDRLTLDRL